MRPSDLAYIAVGVIVAACLIAEAVWFRGE
jgi:hypothetical protein